MFYIIFCGKIVQNEKCTYRIFAQSWRSQIRDFELYIVNTVF